MIPFPGLIVEFILGVGSALFGANLWVLLRPIVARSRDGPPIPRPPSTGRVVVNLVIGAIVAIWAAATLIARA
jgi:hypothetical protein